MIFVLINKHNKKIKHFIKYQNINIQQYSFYTFWKILQLSFLNQRKKWKNCKKKKPQTKQQQQQQKQQKHEIMSSLKKNPIVSFLL